MISLDLQKLNSCQRNWIDEELPEDHITILHNAGNSSPTKQNVNYFKIISITNSQIKRNIFDIANSEIDFSEKNYNTQVLAPLLLIWCANIDETWRKVSKKKLENDHLFIEEVRLNAGISAGTVLTVANQLGYSTGFCACFEPKELQNYLINCNIELSKKEIPILMLGIGLPNNNYNSNVCNYDNHSFTKNKNLLQRKEIISLK